MLRCCCWSDKIKDMIDKQSLSPCLLSVASGAWVKTWVTAVNKALRCLRHLVIIPMARQCVWHPGTGNFSNEFLWMDLIALWAILMNAVDSQKRYFKCVMGKVMYSYVVSTMPADGLRLGMTKSGPHIDVRQVLQKFRMHGRSYSFSSFHQDIEAGWCIYSSVYH